MPANSVTLDNAALHFIREKKVQQGQESERMADALMSITKHYDQTTRVFK